MKFVYHGHDDGKKIGVAMPVLDLHQRPLINPRLVDADSPDASFTIEAGRPFLVNHKDYERGLNWVCDFFCAHSEFKCLSRDALPPERKTSLGQQKKNESVNNDPAKSSGGSSALSSASISRLPVERKTRK